MHGQFTLSRNIQNIIHFIIALGIDFLSQHRRHRFHAWPFLNVHMPTGRHQGRNVLGPFGIILGPHTLSYHILFKQVHGIIFKRGGYGQHLPQQNTKGIDVGRFVVRELASDFGGHVARRPSVSRHLKGAVLKAILGMEFLGETLYIIVIVRVIGGEGVSKYNMTPNVKIQEIKVLYLQNQKS
jgi:hypothetical protein